MSSEPVVSADELARRIIEPDQFVADTAAFIDVRIRGSEGKASYSFIGPGVSQNAEQTVNISEPHGFNVGGASMPHNTVNNAHMHYTAEVFVCTSGNWEIRLGQHGEQTFEIGAGTVFSAPTWVFRGFKNIGADDGWLFAILGGDDTGGLLWAPQVLEAAADTGLYLTTDYSVIEADDAPPSDAVVQPMSAERLVELDAYTPGEIAERVVPTDSLDWSKAALLPSVVPGHDSAMAPVIGFGMSEDRRSRPPIWTPHGFTVEWLRVEPGASTGRHRIQDSQALLLIDGDWRVSLNDSDNVVSRAAATGSVVSVPAGTWRELINDGQSPARCLVICGGDGRSRIDWAPELVAAAAERGWSRDADGYIAATDLLGRTAL